MPSGGGDGADALGKVNPVHKSAAPGELNATTLNVKAASGEIKATPLDLKGALGEANATPVDLKGALGEANATPVDLKAVLGEANTTSVDLKAALGEANATPVDLKAALGEANATPVDLKAVLGEANTTLVDLKAALGEDNATAVDLKAALSEVNATPAEMKVTTSDASQQKKGSSPKRSLTESSSSEIIEGDAKRSRLDGILQEPPVLKELYTDVLALKRELTVEAEEIDFVKVLCAKISRPSVVADSPREAFSIVKALKNFTKYRNAAEKRLVRREISANVRDMHQDQRDVRQDHRDVRQDHRDVRQAFTQKTIADSKRDLDQFWAQYNAFRAAAAGSGQGDTVSGKVDLGGGSGKGDTGSGKADLDGGSGKGDTDSGKADLGGGSGNGDTGSGKADLGGCSGKGEESDSKEKLEKNVAATVTEKLAKAENLVNLSGKAVGIGEKAVDVASRAKVVGVTVAENSGKLKTILAGMVSSASYLVRKALVEMGDDGESESDGEN